MRSVITKLSGDWFRRGRHFYTECTVRGTSLHGERGDRDETMSRVERDKTYYQQILEQNKVKISRYRDSRH